MWTSLKFLTISALLATSLTAFVGPGRAAPIGEPLALAKTAPSATQPVYWRGRGWGWGAPTGESQCRVMSKRVSQEDTHESERSVRGR
jgi:hypothetical protein